MRVKFELLQSGSVMLVHVDQEISKQHIAIFLRPIRSESNKCLEMVGEVGATLVRALLGIDGITQVVIEPYTMAITKGELFNWEDLRNQIFTACSVVDNEIQDVLD